MENSALKKKIVVILAFAATYIVWGTTYLAITFALQAFAPFMLSALRYFTAGVLLLVFCLIKKTAMPRGHDLRILIFSGILMLVGGTGLLTWAEQYIHSGSAAVIFATEPLLFLLFDKKRWSFYFSRKKIIIGLVTGFIGILIFVYFATVQAGEKINLHDQWMGNLVLFGGAILWVMGSLYSKTVKDPSLSVVSSAAVQLVAAGIFSALCHFLLREKFNSDLMTAKPVWSLVYLILFGSIITYLAFCWLLTVRPPAQVGTHTYVNPGVAMLAGWLFAHEQVTVFQIAGLVVILIGVIMTNSAMSSTCDS